MQGNTAHHTHELPPFFDGDSKILILGSFPSVKSRETGFYYGHPQNRFWRVLAAVCGEEPPVSVDDRKVFLQRNGIALWDVIAECDITGSSDSSIRNVIPCDLPVIFANAPIRHVFLNGRLAEKLFLKYQKDSCAADYTALPSTSPANAAWGFERLLDAWRAVAGYL